jgi:hypothetical protein
LTQTSSRCAGPAAAALCCCLCGHGSSAAFVLQGLPVGACMSAATAANCYVAPMPQAINFLPVRFPLPVHLAGTKHTAHCLIFTLLCPLPHAGCLLGHCGQVHWRVSM